MSTLPGMPVVAKPVVVEPVKWTEREVLDALHRRFCRMENGLSPRYALAEHVRIDPTWPNVIIDAVTVDTWRSAGWALDGFEVKVSRSDLRRELKYLGKSGAWDGILDTFTIVAPRDVLREWQALGMPETWGVLAVTDATSMRWLRKPPRVNPYGQADPVPRSVVASLSRSIAKTAQRHCSRVECRGEGA